MVILDSNIWISFLNKNDFNHKKAKKIFQDLEERIIITEYIILEVATVLAEKVSKDKANRFIELAIDNKDVEVRASSKQFFNELISFYLAGRAGKLSFVDYSLLYLSVEIKVLTFDKDLKKAIHSQ